MRSRCATSIAAGIDRNRAACCTLTPVGWAPTHAKSPRFFGLDPAGKILYAANADEGQGGRGQQNTDAIVAFSINQADGKLTPTGRIITVNSPCTIVFAGG